MPDKKRRQNGGRWAWRLGRLDIRVKSPQAQANCARSQISGAVTQIVVSSLTAASVLQSFDPVPLAIWVLAIYSVIQFIDNVLSQATRLNKIPDWIVDSSNYGQVKFILAGLVLAGLIVFRPQGIFGDRREQVFDVR